MKNKKNFAALLLITVIAFVITIFMTNCVSEKADNTAASSADSDISKTTTAPIDTIDPDKIEWNGDNFKPKENSGLFNILLIGQDRRPGEGRQRAARRNVRF